MVILAIDPGKCKVGIAFLNQKGEILERGIIAVNKDFSQVLREKIERYQVKKIVVGNSTCSKEITEELKKLELEYELVEEKGSSLEARNLYFEENPPRGWKKLLPKGLLVPECDVDDYAAVIIGRRYLDKFLRRER